MRRGWTKKGMAVLLLVLALVMPVLAAGTIPIPSQPTWFNDSVNDVNCEGVIVQVKWYHETEDTNTLHVALSVHVYGEGAFAWAIANVDGVIWFYADSDRDGKAEWRIEYDKAIERYVTWCNVYNGLRKGR